MKLDERATAERTGLAVKTLQNWRSMRQGPPFYKVGARVLYDAVEIDAWLATKRRVTTESADIPPPTPSARLIEGVVTHDSGEGFAPELLARYGRRGGPSQK